MPLKENRRMGFALFREVYGEEAAAGMEAYCQTDAFGVECARWTADFTLGTVWQRERLARKQKSIAVLSMLIALRQSDEIRHHTRMGIANGLTRDELEEIVYLAIPYCGFPAANVAKAAMMSVFAETDGARE